MESRKRPRRAKASIAFAAGGVVLFVAVSLRLVVLLSSADDLSDSLGPEATLWVVLVVVLFVPAVMLLLVAMARLRRSLRVLRTRFPAALVQTVTVRVEHLDAVRAWGVRPGARIPTAHGLVAQLVVTGGTAALYSGRRPRLVVQMAGDGLSFSIGSTTTIAGTFEHLELADKGGSLPPVVMFAVDPHVVGGGPTRRSLATTAAWGGASRLLRASNGRSLGSVPAPPTDSPELRWALSECAR